MKHDVLADVPDARVVEVYADSLIEAYRWRSQFGEADRRNDRTEYLRLRAIVEYMDHYALLIEEAAKRRGITLPTKPISHDYALEMASPLALGKLYLALLVERENAHVEAEAGVNASNYSAAMKATSRAGRLRIEVARIRTVAHKRGIHLPGIAPGVEPVASDPVGPVGPVGYALVDPTTYYPDGKTLRRNAHGVAVADLRPGAVIRTNTGVWEVWQALPNEVSVTQNVDPLPVPAKGEHLVPMADVLEVVAKPNELRATQYALARARDDARALRELNDSVIKLWAGAKEAGKQFRRNPADPNTVAGLLAALYLTERPTPDSPKDGADGDGGEG